MIGSMDSVLMRTLLRPLLAALQLFAAYVVVHGHYGPGGGFQGGVLLAASLILPVLVYGPREPAAPVVKGEPRRLAPLYPPLLSERSALLVAVFGLAFYAALGLAGLVRGASLLDYAELPLPGVERAERRSLGVLGIEVGVAAAVAGAVLFIFYRLYADVETKERP